MKTFTATVAVVAVFAGSAAAQNFACSPGCATTWFANWAINCETAVSKTTDCLNGSSCSSGDISNIINSLNSICENGNVIGNQPIPPAPTPRSEPTSTADSPDSVFTPLTPLTGRPSNAPWNTMTGGPFDGAWGPFVSGVLGPWTLWWDGSACPPWNWPGWTSGPWATSAPWTSWSGCVATTTVTAVVSTATGGQVVTVTSNVVRVAEATAGSSAGAAQASKTGSSSAAQGTNGAVGRGVPVEAGVLGALAVGLLGAVGLL